MNNLKGVVRGVAMLSYNSSETSRDNDFAMKERRKIVFIPFACNRSWPLHTLKFKTKINKYSKIKQKQTLVLNKPQQQDTQLSE